MGKSVIYKINLKPFLHQVWQNRPVWKFYTQMRNHLNSNLGPEIASIFAEPIISKTAEDGLTDSSWLSDKVSKNARTLSSLNGEEYAQYESLLAYYVKKINDYTQELLNSNNKKEQDWGELLNKAIEVPSYEHVLIENESIVLVLWGFKSVSQATNFALSKKIEHVAAVNPFITPIDENIDPPVENLKLEEEEIVKEEPFDFEQEPTEEFEVEEEKPKIEDGSIEPTPTSAEVVEEEKPEETNSVKKSSWWKKWWWLILLLLGIILILLLFRNCNNYSTPLLPENPNIIVPIDSSDIVYDEDSTQQIASNRLNIAITDSSKQIIDFAKDFKKLYPKKSYQVIYYDSTTKRVQIRVPTEERNAVREKLKEELKDYDLLIWEESIFQSKGIPTDPYFGNNSKSWYLQKINAYSAWDLSKGDKKIKVAIIDEGFDLRHPELSNNIINPKNVALPKQSIKIGPTGHGTHVAGTAIGAMDNNKGLAGIAPNCEFIPIQVGDPTGRMSNTAVIDAVLYAIQQEADVINMSLGKLMHPRIVLMPEMQQEQMTRFLFKDEEAFWNQLFSITNKKGITVVLAGGNQNVIIGLDPMQRTPYTINVSATDPNNRKASFSNYGKRSTVSAPGVQIYSSIPNANFGPMDGTSMAAPIVTGAVALIKSVNPALTNQEIADLLQNTGVPLGSAIGPLIQLDAALGIVDKKRKRSPKVDCPDAQDRIDDLLREIERIKEECDERNLGDTLKIPKGSNDLGLIEGRWKSTTPIFNIKNGEKLEVFFDFQSNGRGKITLVEPDNTSCSGDLAVRLNNAILDINQITSAICQPPPGSYQPYTFKCEPDRNNCVKCSAQNKINLSNQFTFTLVKVNAIR